MSAASERKVVLVTRKTRLAELIARYHTLAQSRFYIEHLGADFSDYVNENERYAQSLQTVVTALEAWGRHQVIDRLVYGRVTREHELKLRSRMPDNGVIFSDGMEADYLRFTAGMEAHIAISGNKGQLVV